MTRMKLQRGVATATFVALVLAITNVGQANSAQEVPHSIWTLQSQTGSTLNALSLASDLSALQTGLMISVKGPDGQSVNMRLNGITHLRLGGAVLTARSEDGRNALDLVTVAGQAFGAWSRNGNVQSIIFSDAKSGVVMRDAGDLALLPARVEAETLKARALSYKAGPAVAWISGAFEDRYGLASSARLQYLIADINNLRAQNGRGAIELVATRKVTEAGNDPSFAAGGVVITTAKPLAGDSDLALAAAVLPSTRSVKTGVTATAFATIINPGASDATDCGLAMNGSAPAGTFHFQETDASNQPVGTEDQSVTIASNAAQSYVFSFAANAAQDPGLELPIEFTCSNRQSAVIVSGLNTLFFSASDVDVPDIIALSDTGSAVGLNTSAGVVDMIDRAKDGAFVVATANVGVEGEITVSASSSAPASLPVNLLVCQTNPVSGACLAAPAAQTSLTFGAGTTPSFAFFVNSNTVWPFDPAANRINVIFKQGSKVRGSTSVALRTLQGTPDLPSTSIDYEAIAENLPAHFTTAPTTMGGGNGGGNGGGMSRFPLNEDNTPVDNPVTNAGATLGRVLFHDKRLSINDTISCSSCHDQSMGFSDDEVLSLGFAGGHTGRHSMGLANARFYEPEAFFWDERAATLEDQVLMPIQDGVEMGMTLDVLLPKLQAVDFYPALFTSAFGDVTITADRISKALAQFVRSLVSTNSKFDLAYVNGTVDNPDFEGTFSAQELLGQRLFMPSPNSGVQSLGCTACHGTTAQILDVAQNNGLDANTDADQGSGDGRFKAPSLRNIAERAPYMHDGRFSTLEDVVEFYNSGIQPHLNLSMHLREGGPNGPPRRMNLTAEEKSALVAFLNTLTDQNFLSDTRFSDPFNKR